jgi:hypothetical protein
LTAAKVFNILQCDDKAGNLQRLKDKVKKCHLEKPVILAINR